MPKLSPSKYCHCTQSSADAPIVASLWKLSQMLSCSKNNAYLDKTNLTCVTNMIAVQPSVAKYEWTMYNFFLFSLFYRNFESNPGFLLRNSIELILKTWKSTFDMFYKNYCWAVIYYPICVTNVSYERRIKVLPFPVISFVILLFVFHRFEIKSGWFFFIFLYSHCIVSWTYILQKI